MYNSSIYLQIFKKRHNYETIIVDEKTHKPIAILEGRDGKTYQIG